MVVQPRPCAKINIETEKPSAEQSVTRPCRSVYGAFEGDDRPFSIVLRLSPTTKPRFIPTNRQQRNVLAERQVGQPLHHSILLFRLPMLNGIFDRMNISIINLCYGGRLA